MTAGRGAGVRLPAFAIATIVAASAGAQSQAAESERPDAAAEQAAYARAYAQWEERTRPVRAERSRKQTIGFVAAGSGIAFVIAGGMLTAGDADELQRVLGLTALGLGAGGIVAGLVFLLSAPDLEPEPRPPGRARPAEDPEVVPVVAPGAFGALVRLRL